VSDCKLVSVVIVNYFSEELAARCIRSILEAEPATVRNMEFTIVDNGSKEDWGPLLEGLPNVSLIDCGANTGFASAANRGIRAARSEYVLLINPDSRVCLGAISRAVAFMQDPVNRTVAILGPKVYDDMAARSVQPSARSFPGLAQALFGRHSLLTRLWPSSPWSRRYFKSDSGCTSPTRVDWVSGCCMLIRSSLFEQIGMLDERYFMYFEDVDLCRRAWAKGWEVAYFPEAEIIHQIGASSRLRPMRMIAELHRSAWIYYTKFSRGSAATRAIVLFGICARAVIDIIACLVGIWARRLGSLRSS
jgi:N-acetylglucosaminyl-diphospho-decaprenol L-rhamnosyltransferase